MLHRSVRSDNPAGRIGELRRHKMRRMQRLLYACALVAASPLT